jgi:hypothetical protein
MNLSLTPNPVLVDVAEIQTPGHGGTIALRSDSAGRDIPRRRGLPSDAERSQVHS